MSRWKQICVRRDKIYLDSLLYTVTFAVYRNRLLYTVTDCWFVESYECGAALSQQTVMAFFGIDFNNVMIIFWMCTIWNFLSLINYLDYFGNEELKSEHIFFVKI